jgi:hypothetical protein
VSAGQKPPSDHTYFLDQCLGRKTVAEALRHYGLHVQVHTDHFPDGTKDEVWLREVGRRRWIVFTKDDQIRWRQPEMEALLTAHVRAFVLTSGELQGPQMAEAFVKAMPRIERILVRIKEPFVAKVMKSGRVEVLRAKKLTRR